MWVWRDDVAGGGWRLDAYGTWIWDEPALLEREGIGVDALRWARGRQAAIRRERPARREPWAWRAGEPAAGPAPGQDATPIFHALSVDHDRRATMHVVPPVDEARIPAPGPGSGPIPTVTARSGLAEVPTVPPPSAAGDRASEAASGAAYESPEDEMRRRAERRRRPRAAEPASGGRHAMRAPEPAVGRHAARSEAQLPRGTRDTAMR